MKQVKTAVRALLNRPLAIFVLPFLAGILLEEYTNVPLWLSIGAALLSALLLMVGILRRILWLSITAGTVLACAIGFVRLSTFYTAPENHFSRYAIPERAVHARGVVASEPVFYEPMRNAMDEESRQPRALSRGYFLVDIDSVILDGRPTNTVGCLKLNFYERDVSFQPGDRIEFQGTFKSFREPSNPGQFDYQRFMKRRGIDAACSVSKADLLTLLEPASRWSPFSIIHAGRTTLKSISESALPPNTASLINGLLLGYRENVSDELTRNLQRTGTAHFLAISGLHLVLIYAFLHALLFATGIRVPLRSILLILFLVLYTLMSGMAVSVVRATIMIVMYLGADLVWRQRDSMNAMAASLWLILLVMPTQLFDTGFQLSYLAVMGIIHIAPHLQRFLSESTGEEHDRIRYKLSEYLVGSIAISLGAYLMTAPIIPVTFHLVTPISIIANLILAPLMTLMLLLGIVVLIMGTISLALAEVLGSVIHGVLSVVEWLSRTLAELPLSYTYVPTTPIWFVVVLYALLLLWVLWYQARPRRFKLACLLVLIFLPGVPGAFRMPRDGLTLTMLDVGKGQAIVAEYPDGRTMVYDCGSLSYRDVGKSVVAPFLWDRNIVKIDTLILSHPDADHINGAASLIEFFRPRRLVVSKHFGRDATAAKILKMFDPSQIVYAEDCIRSDPQCLPGMTLLAPPVWEDRMPTDNDTSVAVRLDYEKHSILLTGDLEEPTIRDWIDHRVPIQAEILQLPHHGKMMGSFTQLADRVKPEIVLVSAPLKYYSEQVISAYRKNARVLITGTSGAIMIYLKDHDSSVKTHRLKE